MRKNSLPNQKATSDLVNRILRLEKKADSLVIDFAGCYPGDGVSSVLTYLAQYLIALPLPQKSLFVDMNGAHSVLHEKLGVEKGDGLLNVMSGQVSLEKAVRPLPNSNVSLLQFGETQKEIGHFCAESLWPIFDRIKAQYPLVFIDSPMILNAPESLSGARIADYTFLVIASGRVPAKAANRSKQLIEANDGKLAGIILNRAKYEIPQWLYRFI